jgi:hypothetical protein
MVAEVILNPEPAGWAPAVLRHRPDPIESIRNRTRTGLGLDPNRPVLATGHQAAIWHPGILAKDLAIAAASASVEDDFQPIHFVADHDADDGGLICLPSGVGPTLKRLEWRVLPAARGVGSRDRAAAPTAPPPGGDFTPEVRAGIDAIRNALEERRDAPSLAMQIAGATAALATPFTGPIPRHSMSSLLEAPIGEWILDRLSADPASAASSHDAAIETHRRRRTGDRTGRPPRGVARLLDRGSRLELPLWRATPEGRMPVFADEKLDPRELRPRAMLATALCRLAACDGFVHGLGGAVYDEAMEIWIEDWLGTEIARSLAPAFIATATCRLHLVAPGFDRDADPTLLHRLRNDPDLGRVGPPRRDRFLSEIEDAPRRSPARRQAYLKLRDAVDAAREDQAERLDALESTVRGEATARSTAMIAEDRTWAFPLHRIDEMESLGTAIRSSFPDTT